MFWADELAERAIQKKNKKCFVVSDTKTPSGKIHVGALEGVLYHGAVAEALKKKGKKVDYIYGFDDYDPMDSLPNYVPKDYEKYMGISLSEIPAIDGKGSFADQFADEFIRIFNKLDEKPKIIYSSQMYKNGEYNQAIKIALTKASIIRDIYKKIANQERPKDWLPIQMVCESCQKIGTTRAYDWDGREISYECGENWVKYTKGCGYKGKQSPLNGNAKLPWKVEWAAKWFIWGTDIEGAGKDHMTKNGSHDMAKAFVKQVYGINAPESFRYEFFLVGGKKMSSSKGLGNSAQEVSDFLPPQLLRFLILNSKPESHIDFDLSDRSIIKLFNDFDIAKAEENFYHMRFGKVVSLIQISNIDIFLVAKEEKGSALSPEEEVELRERMKYAQKYLENFASDEEKFEIQKKVPIVSLSDKQKKILEKIADFIKNNDNPEEIHNFIYNSGKELGLSPKETFEAIYKIFLNKTSGPKAGWFLANLDKDFVLKRLKEAIS